MIDSDDAYAGGLGFSHSRAFLSFLLSLFIFSTRRISSPVDQVVLYQTVAHWVHKSQVAFHWTTAIWNIPGGTSDLCFDSRHYAKRFWSSSNFGFTVSLNYFWIKDHYLRRDETPFLCRALSFHFLGKWIGDGLCLHTQSPGQPPRSHSGDTIQMLSFRSLLFFTLLHLDWIAKSAHAVPVLEESVLDETPIYDFVVIGGGNAYVDLSLLHDLRFIDG